MVDTASFRRPVRTLQKDDASGHPDGEHNDHVSLPGEVSPLWVDTVPPTIPETAPEQGEGSAGGEQHGESAIPQSSGAHGTASISADPSITDSEKMQKKIESILSYGLEAEFRSMTPAVREQFRVEGEKTASVIRQFIERSKVTAKKVLELIRQWLTMIPGINRFFLEQEAKIKTDRVLELSHPHTDE